MQHYDDAFKCGINFGLIENAYMPNYTVKYPRSAFNVGTNLQFQ